MKKKILFVVDNMDTGGVQRVLINLLESFNYNKYDVDLVVLDCFGDLLKKIPNQVNILKTTSFFNVIDKRINDLICGKKYFKILKKIILFFLMKTGLIIKKILIERKKILKKVYDSEIAFNDGFCTLFVAYGNSKKKINWVHTDYSMNNYSKNHLYILKKALQKINVNIAVSEEVSNSFKNTYSLESRPIVIYNIINNKKIIFDSDENIDFSYDNRYFNIVSVGRIDMPKGYDRFLEVHKLLTNECYKYKFYLIGDGQEKKKIEKKIKEYGIEDSFILLGKKQNPFPYVKKADLFLLPSIFEGMPTVILEALALHIPVLSTNVSGVKTILKNNYYGKIVDNSFEGLYNGLREILNNKKTLNIYRNNLKYYKHSNNGSFKKIYKVIGE